MRGVTAIAVRSLKTKQHAGRPVTEVTMPSRPLPGRSTFREGTGSRIDREQVTGTLGKPVRELARERPLVLPRKEVIQPHLPVRLPCYDFTPITSPTFDGSFPYGLGHRLRVLPTFVV